MEESEYLPLSEIWFRVFKLLYTIREVFFVKLSLKVSLCRPGAVELDPNLVKASRKDFLSSTFFPNDYLLGIHHGAS